MNNINANVNALFDAYDCERKTLDKTRSRRDRLTGLIARHQKTLARLETACEKEWHRLSDVNPVCNGGYLKPVIEAVLPHFPGMAARIMGPYGLGATSAITIYDPELGDDKGAVCWLQFRYDRKAGKLWFVDLTQKLNRYPKGSLGDFNGLDYATVEITPEMTSEELARRFVAVN